MINKEAAMTDETMWRAVQARNRRADDVFVYAVQSTGIYCRPSCPSRRPRRERVAFFRDPAAAEREGFRPCRRCRPREGPAADPRAERVRRACARIAAEPERRWTLAALGRVVGASPWHLQRTFRELLGVSPREYADLCRLGRVKNGLRAGAVTAAAYDAGYGSGSRLYERAPGRLGMTPATYGRGGAGVRIYYAIRPGPLGRLLVGATDRGVCAVQLGDSDADLLESLRAEYPRAELVADRAGGRLGRWVAAILASLEGRVPALDLPIDVRATAFQCQVWRELLRIPRGQTRSYSAIARRIGRPAAVRAVARACATNPVALVVPCHRVVQSSGGLGGYRWGIERKRALLAREREASRGAKEERRTAKNQQRRTKDEEQGTTHDKRLNRF